MLPSSPALRGPSTAPHGLRIPLPAQPAPCAAPPGPPPAPPAAPGLKLTRRPTTLLSSFLLLQNLFPTETRPSCNGPQIPRGRSLPMDCPCHRLGDILSPALCPFPDPNPQRCLCPGLESSPSYPLSSYSPRISMSV